MIRGSIII